MAAPNEDEEGEADNAPAAERRREAAARVLHFVEARGDKAVTVPCQEVVAHPRLKVARQLHERRVQMRRRWSPVLG